MSQTGLAAFDSTIQTTNVWIREVTQRMAWTDHHRAYRALRAVLHALRDRLTVEQAAALAAQLPMLVRGFYYEGWHPAGTPIKERKKEQFLGHVREAFREDPHFDAEQATRAVLSVVAKHVTEGEVSTIRHLLPSELRELWPEPVASA